MVLLALETARDVCSVAIERDGAVLASMTLLRPRSHAERLVPMVVETMKRAGVAFAQTEAVAVSAGPGSYTGLRIGVSTAKGLCMTTGARLIGVPTMSSYAHAMRDSAARARMEPEIGCIALNARRSEVYFATYTLGSMAELDAPRITSVTDAASRLDELAESGGIAVGGDGTAAVLLSVTAPGVHRVDFVASASYVASVGRELLRGRGEDDLDRFEPYYLKDYVAKRPATTVFDRLPF